MAGFLKILLKNRMRTCIIQTNNAPQSLIRFTEIGCLFNYENKWLDFFQNIIITNNADSIKTPGWKINAGQYITTKVRKKYEKVYSVDLRNSNETLNYSKNHWTDKKEMKFYRGMKQEYIFRNYMVMILKSKTKMIYFSNNEKLPNIKNYQGELWVPASGTMAGQLQFKNPNAKITIYDINQTQLDYSKWLNSQKQYPNKKTVNGFVCKLGKISIAEKFKKVNNWVPVNADYKCVDLLDIDLICPTVISNILRYMPVYHVHGFAGVEKWKKNNLHLTI